MLHIHEKKSIFKIQRRIKQYKLINLTLFKLINKYSSSKSFKMIFEMFFIFNRRLKQNIYFIDSYTFYLFNE